MSFFFFFFNDTATTEIYTLSLHDALPIYLETETLRMMVICCLPSITALKVDGRPKIAVEYAPLELVRFIGYFGRSEEHTSELQSHSDIACRLLLEQKTNSVSTSSTVRCIR